MIVIAMMYFNHDTTTIATRPRDRRVCRF